MGKPVDKTPVSTPQSPRSSKSDNHTTQVSDIPEQKLRRSKAFPLRIRYTEKFHHLHNEAWRKRMPPGSSGQAPFARALGAVELFNTEGASKFNVDGGLTDNAILREGQPIPKEIIAVVRPTIVLKKRGDSNGRTDQQSIVPDEMEMSLECSNSNPFL